MLYLASFVAGRHKTVMWAALTLRWLAHITVGHWTATITLLISVWLGAPFTFGFTFAVLVGVTAFFGFNRYREFAHIMAFRRRWPHTWATVQRKQITDMDDGHYNRPWLTAPKLGLLYRRNHQAIIFKIRPAVGSNLNNLQEQVSDLAAQYRNIDSIEISFVKPSDYRGELKLLLKDTMAETKHLSDERIPYAPDV